MSYRDEPDFWLDEFIEEKLSGESYFPIEEFSFENEFADQIDDDWWNADSDDLLELNSEDIESYDMMEDFDE
jgi:hypothetical protein